MNGVRVAGRADALVMREVEMLLVEGRAVDAKPLKEHHEVKGYADAVRWL
jgi:hypothetical protein